MQKSVVGDIKSSRILNNNVNMVNLQNTSKTSLSELRNEWSKKESITCISPVLLDETGREIGGFTNQLLVRIKSDDDYQLLIRSLAAYSVLHVETTRFDPLTYLITLGKDTAKNTMQIAGELYESGLFACAEPNLIHFIQPCTNDELFSQQWALKNTGQS